MITSATPFASSTLTFTTEGETGLAMGTEATSEIDMQRFLKFCSGGVDLPLGDFETYASEGSKVFIQAVLRADPSLRPSAPQCLGGISRIIRLPAIGSGLERGEMNSEVQLA